MSKIADALKRVDKERMQVISPTRGKISLFNSLNREGIMRKSWWLWGTVVLIVTVFVAFNYHQGQDAVPLSEIFPDEEVYPVDVEYEFVKEEVAADAAASEAQTVTEDTLEVTPEAAASVAEAVTTSESVKTPAYTIQIASFKDEKRAQTALTDIRKKVPSAYIARRDLGAKGIWYRVYAGRFDARQEAEVSLNDIKKSYDSSFIITPK